MLTVESSGSPKWSIALAEFRAIDMNTFCCQSGSLEFVSWAIVIRETK